MRRNLAGTQWLCGILMGPLAACVGTGAKPQSGWAVLETASTAKCAPWPLREKDLGVKAVARGGQGFHVSGMRRDTAPMHYFAAFDGDPDLDADSFAALDLGRGALLIGGAEAAGKEYAFVARSSGGKAQLEVRSVVDNVVRFKGDLADQEVEEGTVVAAPTGAWISVKAGDDSFRVFHLAMDGAMALTAVPGATRDAPPRVLVRPGAPKGALLVWHEGETGEPFKSQWIGTDGKAEAPQLLELPVASQLESWTAVAFGDGYYLAVVDGDSLIGQSELKISSLNWDGNKAQVRWTKASAMRDEHVTEPVFLETDKGLEALVLKWIDEESTIARYMVAAGTVGKPEFSGIFQKGSRIVEAFTAADGEGRFVVVRSRAETGWSFKVCEI